MLVTNLNNAEMAIFQPLSDCSVKTKDGECCKFPFRYKGKDQTECVKGKAGNWCGVTYNYDEEKKWGWCEDCSVKTKDGECCKFPFRYKGKDQTECVKGKAGNWCGVTYNYDEEKKWGWCEDQDCSVKTKDGECCKFPFLYKGTEQTECVIGKAGNWCGVTYNYDEEKKWGWCEGGSVCSVKTEDGTCCSFPFLYKGVKQNECVKGKAGSWCGVTSNYDEDKLWGWCEGKAPVCHAKTVDGTCCTFPFLYKGTKQTSCVKGDDGSWCGLTYNYDEDKKWGWCKGKEPCIDEDGVLSCLMMKSFACQDFLLVFSCARTCGLCGSS